MRFSVATPAKFALGGTATERRRLYRALAELLAAAPARSTVVVESGTTIADPLLTVRPAWIADALLGQPSLRPLLRTAVPQRGHPRRDDRFAVLLPAEFVPGRAPLSWGGPDRTIAAAVAGRGAALDTQTFWACGPERRVWVARRIRIGTERPPGREDRFAAIAGAAAAEWGRAVGRPASIHETTWGGRSAWNRLAPPRALGGWASVDPTRLDRTAEADATPDAPTTGGHCFVLGASGAGKTLHLADRAVAAVRHGRSVVVLDVHGDLSIAIAARLTAVERTQIIGIDVERPPFPGIAAIDPSVSADRAVAHVVASLKRLTPDSGELYWGFRLERLLEAFVRLAHEQGGSLRDAYALLTDGARRDAARFATSSPDLARLLEELEPVLRRQPDFLWGAASRLAKAVTVPALGELLAPPDGGLPVERAIVEGASIVVRIPFAGIGPEAAAFAGSLLLGRLYFGAAAARTGPAGRPDVLVVLDEVQAFSPRLVAEMYAEARKFGWRLVAATQYPERLAPELRASVAADVEEIVAFRLAAPAAAAAGEWLGLDPSVAARILPQLAAGAGISARRTAPEPTPVPPRPMPERSGRTEWEEITLATRTRFAPTASSPGPDGHDTLTDRLLLAILGAREEGRPVPEGGIAAAVDLLPGTPVDAAALDDRLRSLRREGAVELRDDGWALTPVGDRRLGLGRPTGAPREGPEHRRLLFAAFRIFARHGYRLEIVRQGRFDAQLPDARLRQLPDPAARATPETRATAMDRARAGWAWRYFRGRDVHVEAEVWGALRPDRIRRDLEKATREGAVALFVVGDPSRAAKIRRVLRTDGVPRENAIVWLIPSADRRDPVPTRTADRLAATSAPAART